ncbi:hypothetical protein NMY22_g12476 [Coprinellus aureogranulatus]|nr:hypothetical protein NMY22_g12476 [Coprinellus aureogranulatus]
MRKHLDNSHPDWPTETDTAMRDLLAKTAISLEEEEAMNIPESKQGRHAPSIEQREDRRLSLPCPPSGIDLSPRRIRIPPPITRPPDLPSFNIALEAPLHSRPPDSY